MPENRFFIESSLADGDTVLLFGDEARHLISVMRAREGDTVELINGIGSLARAQVSKIKKGGAELIVQTTIREEKPRFEIILAQGLPKPNRLDLILEKGTELGVTKFWFFPAAHSDKKNFTNLERAHKILIAAAKQCGRLFLPELKLKPPLLQWEKPEYSLFFGDLAEGSLPLHRAWNEQKPDKGIVFFIGPESGFDSREEAFLRSWNAGSVKLHTNILRTDTAAICALSQIAEIVIK